ncbi:hypothetical protein CesoFtcFv8_018652 [Champsocephalus esox]|uniref:Uncharacterized protein n=2 Tax=Champsocephalus TaxID=52236 RepID=A0AAN8D542_CHAGU|nr:hypothetical protein CesoFtcFv8_018652 [Champsocephalus esox]KAK5913953.1 hypothetical protein CgunFtcFv8_008432 [Champsocephalus gunnari]
MIELASATTGKGYLPLSISLPFFAVGVLPMVKADGGLPGFGLSAPLQVVECCYTANAVAGLNDADS